MSDEIDSRPDLRTQPPVTSEELDKLYYQIGDLLARFRAHALLEPTPNNWQAVTRLQSAESAVSGAFAAIAAQEDKITTNQEGSP